MEVKDVYQQRIVLKRTGDSVFEIGDPDEYHNRPHMCETCGKRFTLLENLNRHQMIHTDERPYICSYCKKRFRLAQHLKEHIRIHTGEKPYKCTTCGRAFCQISNLKSHQKTHTKIKAFKCDICEKSFRRSFTLKQHKLTHTRHSYSAAPDTPGPDSSLVADHKKINRKYSAPTPTFKGSLDQMRNLASQQGQDKIGYFAFPNFQWQNKDGENVSSIPTTSISSLNPSPVPSPFIASSLFSKPSMEDDSLSRKRKIQETIVKQEIVKSKYISQPPSSNSFSYFPSLSALLSQDSDQKEERLRKSDPRPSQNSYHISPLKPQHFRTPQSRPFEISSAPAVLPSSSPRGSSQVIFQQTANDSGGHVIPKNENTLIYSPGKERSSSVQSTCMQCDTTFGDSTELREHVMNCHSRKDQRRDSAYSSHSDKSLPSSPNCRSISQTSTSQNPKLNHDVTEDIRPREDDTQIMKRVKELALQALNRKTEYEMRHELSVTNSPRPIKQELHIESEVPKDCPAVGHSPTESPAPEASERESAKPLSPTVDEKKMEEDVNGSRKWKRRLCKEWYDLPSEKNPQTRGEVLDEKDNQPGKEVLDTEEKIPEYVKPDDSHSPKCLWPPMNNPNLALIGSRNTDEMNDPGTSENRELSSKEKEESNTKHSSQPGHDLCRFAPIVEWKPVITGWKDMVYGTLFAVPPHLQNYLGFPAYGTAELAHSQPAAPSDHGDASAAPATGTECGNATFGNYFRFSPQFIQSFEAFNRQTPVTPDPPSGTSSVYNGSYYPSEPLPISGYSRLQHGLLYNWDPNRNRLGGTSSVPQSANWVTAK